MREWARTLSLALVLSAGLHLIAVIVLDVPLLGAGPGFPQGLHLQLRSEPGAAPPAMAPDGRPPARAAASGLPGTDRYYRRSELDEPAMAVSQVPLVIPEHAYHSRLGGKVRARVFIGADGRVDRVAILEAEPVRGLFEQPAFEALREMRYRPARIGDRPVKSQKVVEVVFDPRADGPNARR